MTDMDALKQLEALLTQSLGADRRRFKRRLSGLRKRATASQPIDRGLEALQRDVAVSVSQRQARAAPLPPIRFDTALPIAARADEIAAAIGQHQVVVVAGETGSGKTTQLPKICLQAGRGLDGMIGVTQPRRIAARSIARRLTEELDSELGGLIGYQVRFEDRLGADTRIKLMTDGILLAETQRDRWLDRYDTIIIDEAHERSLNIDFLLGYLRQLLPRRPDLKVIITSATIDTARFSEHFDRAPIIEVSGRTYPVEMRYRPLEDDDGLAIDVNEGIARALDELDSVDPIGDVLVFLPGERDIREAQQYLERQQRRNTQVLPLYARLSAKAQGQIFHPGSQRRIILSTNVAETSLTVPRIKFVIDSGLARISRYSHRSKVQRLPIEPISQASTNQRAGRCGRLGPGTCIRLFDQNSFDNRPEFTEPEIVRTNLATVILKMASLRLGAVDEFPFVDKPDPRLINDGYQLLDELGALDQQRRLTQCGHQMARWPLDVRLARLLVAAVEYQCVTEAVVLAAGLAIADPRERPLEAQKAADDAHAQWADEQSDFVAMLKLWADYATARDELSRRQLQRWCEQRYLHGLRMREWGDLQHQFHQLIDDTSCLNKKAASYEAVHRALLTAFLGHVSVKDDREYVGARQRRLRLFPGSGLFKRGPKWLLSAFVVETAQVYARTNARVEPAWVEQAAPEHLLKRRHYEPYWSKRAGKVLGYEQITLFGLTLAAKRRIDYGPRDPAEARQVFLLDALTRGELDTKGRFLKHNLRLVEKVIELEIRQRSQDLLVDESEIASWYGQRVPETIYTAKDFERWRVTAESKSSKLLYLRQDVILRANIGERETLFPTKLTVNGTEFSLRYLFKPGHVNDGVTIRVPLHALNVVDDGTLQWLVPGLLREKVVALIKSLPKPVRRLFVPVPDTAERFVDRGRTKRGLHDELARWLSAESGQTVTAESFDLTPVADYLKFNVHLFDGNALLGGGRDLALLQSEFGEQAREEFFDQAGAAFHRDGLTRWEFGSLPESVELEQGMSAWPAIVDQQDSVGLRLFDTPLDGRAYHRVGVARLLRLMLHDKFRYLPKSLGLSGANQLHYAAVGDWSDLVDDALEAIALALVDERPLPRDAAAMASLCTEARARAGILAQQFGALLSDILQRFYDLRRRLEARDFAALFAWAYEDISSQLGYLLYPGFIAETGLARLAELPRYLEAIDVRLDGLNHDPARDQQRWRQVDGFWADYRAKVEAEPEETEILEPFRWLLEEFRVSLFAQRLKTKEAVSVKRLAKQWAQLIDG